MNIHEHVSFLITIHFKHYTHKHENKRKGYIQYTYKNTLNFLNHANAIFVYIYIGRVIYYVALLIENEHHSHSLELLSEPTEPELSLYTCRAVGPASSIFSLFSECFFCPRDFEGKSGISWPKVFARPPCPPDAVLHSSSATSGELLAERRHMLILCFTSKYCGSHLH